MNNKKDHICICACTYKRPELLARLLEKILIQKTDNLFTYSVVIVDNDSLQSAKEIVQDFSCRTFVSIKYFSEPEKNIALARNKAVQNADGNLLAFIDDDEFPENTWLLNFYQTLRSSRADGVLGPVIPHFEIQPPKWVLRSRLLERNRFPTGTILASKETRTGNVMFLMHLFKGENRPFDPRFGKTGGEDGDFFHRMFDKGFSFIWCDEAPVFETVSPQRYTRSYFLKRALLRGISQARLRGKSQNNAHSTDAIGVIKSIIACLLYTAALPALFIAGQHLFMKYLVKNCDHFGKLLAMIGIEVLKQRDF